MTPYAAFVAPSQMAAPEREPDVVLICADLLGRRFRFPIVDVFEADNSPRLRESWRAFPPDIYDGEPDSTSWRGHPLLWSY